MTRTQAEAKAREVDSTRHLPGPYTIGEINLEEPLPNNFVVVVFLVGHEDPCVMGDYAGTQAWMDARGIRATEAELRPGQDYTVSRMLHGSSPEMSEEST